LLLLLWLLTVDLLHTPWTLLHTANYTSTASHAASLRSWWRRALSVMAPLAPQRFIRRRGRWRTTPIAIVDVVFHVLVELFEQEGALETHLLDAPIEAQDALAGGVVGFFDIVNAASQVDAFAVVGGLDRGG
jgi:hypothetical protein